MRANSSINRFQGETHLPGLQKASTKDTRSIQQDEIMEIKTKIHQMEADRKILRAKIQRMKNTVQSRNNSIRKVLAQPQNEQSIQTASQSTLQQLREEKTSLENALEIDQKELDELRRCDKLAMSDELKIEIPLFFAEKKRLDDQLANSKEIENVLSQELNRIQNQIASIPSNENAVDEIQFEIDSLTEKLFAYRKSEMKLLAAKDLHKLHKNPNSYEEIKNKIEAEINGVKDEIEKNNEEIQEIQESEDKSMEYLNEVIEKQIKKIKECLAKMTNTIPEEENDENDASDANDEENNRNNGEEIEKSEKFKIQAREEDEKDENNENQEE